MLTILSKEEIGIMSRDRDHDVYVLRPPRWLPVIYLFFDIQEFVQVE